MSTGDSTQPPVIVTPEIEYRLCPGRDGYRVGSDGSVWSKKRKHPHNPPEWDGIWYRLRPVQMKDRAARACVTINGKLIYVHKLVLEAFVGQCPPGMEACHDPDPNPANNALTNLRWGTRRSNMADRDRHGRTAKGSRSGNATITEDTARAIKIAAPSTPAYGRYITLATRFGTTRSVVKKILTGQSWTHVTY